MQMTNYDLANMTISVLTLAWTIGLIARAWFSNEKNYIIDRSKGDPRLTGAGWAFTFWSVWWLSLVFIYISF